LLERFAFQIAELALDFLQGCNDGTHDNLSVYRADVWRETSENAGNDQRAALSDARANTGKHAVVHDHGDGPVTPARDFPSNICLSEIADAAIGAVLD